MDDLLTQLKLDIIESLNLNGLKPEHIGDDQVLFGPELGLDSIDALELIVLLEKKYHLKVSGPDAGKEIFQSVRSMADFIESKQA